ncbi:MAG: cysteine methyltransferase [Chloroflexi bacterium HGW-Chloroflexi-8]|jgi:methylated-DNA-protein-cysteine methyltransferase-like protein|nr:MAG: cysteine methyltransferase [Chloroflexi bacterium HGW-Chloroflexi-8]
MKNSPTYRDYIYEIVRNIPSGKVASYGQIARMVPRCTARMVGFAMASTPENQDIPWQRVINSKGEISPHGAGFGSALQRSLLEQEGIIFDLENKIDLDQFGWQP